MTRDGADATPDAGDGDGAEDAPDGDSPDGTDGADATERHVPDHVRGRCDIGGCDALANWAYDDGETYLEVCTDHAANLGSQFDSDYERVAHDSPYRDAGPRDEIPHGCGGTILVYGTPAGEYRVCTDCSYAMLLEGGDGENGSESVRVTYTDAVEDRS